MTERTINRNNGQIMRLVSLKPDTVGGLYLHITAETPGESASVVPKVQKHKPTDEIFIATTAPPSDAEFMDGDAFVYVRDNDVCLCGTGMHDTTVRYFLHAFFHAARLQQGATQFELLKVANVSKLKLLQSQGVKEIELRATLFEATANYQRRKSQPQGILGALGKQIKAVLGNEHDVNSDALRVMLTLKTDKRRKGIALGEKRIKSLAVDLLNSQEKDDEFVIVTKTDQRIGPDEIHMRSKVLIESIGKSVQRDKAWKELGAFYKTLSAAGALEE